MNKYFKKKGIKFLALLQILCSLQALYYLTTESLKYRRVVKGCHLWNALAREGYFEQYKLTSLIYQILASIESSN